MPGTPVIPRKPTSPSVPFSPKNPFRPASTEFLVGAEQASRGRPVRGAVTPHRCFCCERLRVCTSSFPDSRFTEFSGPTSWYSCPWAWMGLTWVTPGHRVTSLALERSVHPRFHFVTPLDITPWMAGSGEDVQAVRGEAHVARGLRPPANAALGRHLGVRSTVLLNSWPSETRRYYLLWMS